LRRYTGMSFGNIQHIKVLQI